MRKHYVLVLIISIAALLLAGCTEKPSDRDDRRERETSAAQTLPTEPSAAPEAEETETARSEPAETLPLETQAPAETEPMGTELPYLQYIDRADQSIYDGPGDDFGFVDPVWQRGTYTIVEEAADSEGNLWGRLKSGIGWVNLTEIRSGEYAESLISANYADENLLLHGDYHAYITGEEYSAYVAFRAYGRLRDVELFGYELREEGMVPGAVLFTLPELTAEVPLVAELSFPGDMTTYGIRFTDASGVCHTYSIYISGRNGALVLSEE